MAGMTLLQICAGYTDPSDLITALRTLAKADSSVAEGFEDSFVIGVLSAYCALLNKDAAKAEAEEARPLTESEVDELLVNVSISKLERLLEKRRAERDQLLRDCAFPGCENAMTDDGLFCSDHADDGEYLP